VARTELQAKVLPSVEVATSVDGAADLASGVPLGVADGPELLEGLGSVDGGLVDTGGLQDIVVGSVAVNCSLLLGSGRRVVRAIRLNNVIFDECISSPTVDSEVAVAVGLVYLSSVRIGTSRRWGEDSQVPL
jgi:hypothetical protein